MKKLILNIFTLLLTLNLCGQTADEDIQSGQMTINGEIVTWMIDDVGDTLLLASLDEMSISSPRQFENRNDYRRYQI